MFEIHINNLRSKIRCELELFELITFQSKIHIYYLL